MVKQVKITELGCQGHFICRCEWHRHTQVGDAYRVSTVGGYRNHTGKLDTIGSGADDFFETYVFKTSAELNDRAAGCGCHEVTDWGEIEGHRYATAGEAQAGHEEMVARYKEMVK